GHPATRPGLPPGLVVCATPAVPSPRADVERRLAKERPTADSTSLRVAVTSLDAFERTGSRKGPLLYSRRARPDQDHSGAMPNVIAQPLNVAVVGATRPGGPAQTRLRLVRGFP